MPLIVVAIVVVGFIVWDLWESARHRRRSNEFRHITGAKQWWGER